MEISSEIVGIQSRPYEVELTWRQTMNYAAAVGDNNPWYFDDTREGGIIAPPMLSVALTWPLLERYQEFWGDYVPLEVIQRQVHYRECLIWHRAMRPGDRLYIQGELLGIIPHRAGSYMVGFYRAVDASGTPVFDEYGAALLRDVKCVDEGQMSQDVPAVPDLPKDESPLWEKQLAIDPLAAHIYDGCADIAFPIHTSAQFARLVGLPGILLHGTATLAMAVREIVNAEADGDPTRLRSVNCCFAGIVMPGSAITVRARGKHRAGSGTSIFFDVLNAAGRTAISDGYAVIAD